MSASSAGVAPARTAETSARSAPSASRTSTKRRNQPASRAASAPPPGSGVDRVPRRLAGESPPPRPRARGRARPAGRARRGAARGSRSRSASSARGPSPGRAARRRTRCPRGRHDALGRSSSAIAALASTSEMLRSSPSRSRSRWCAIGSTRGRTSTKTSSPRSSTGKTRSVVGELVERAAGAEVEARVVPVAGEDAVRDRAAVEREAHVRAAVVDGVHGVPVGEEAERVAVDVDDEAAGFAQLGERGGADEGVAGDRGHGPSRVGVCVNPRTSSNVEVKWPPTSSRSGSWRGAAASRPRRSASTRSGG